MTAKSAYRAVATGRGRQGSVVKPISAPNPNPQQLRSDPHCVRSNHAVGLMIHDNKGVKTIRGTAKTASMASSKCKSGMWGTGWASGTLQQKVPAVRKVQGPVVKAEKRPVRPVSASFGECMSGVRDLLIDDLGAIALEHVGKAMAPKAGENFPFHAIES